jgi:hypothetical protein
MQVLETIALSKARGKAVETAKKMGLSVAGFSSIFSCVNTPASPIKFNGQRKDLAIFDRQRGTSVNVRKLVLSACISYVQVVNAILSFQYTGQYLHDFLPGVLAAGIQIFDFHDLYLNFIGEFCIERIVVGCGEPLIGR